MTGYGSHVPVRSARALSQDRRMDGARICCGNRMKMPHGTRVVMRCGPGPREQRGSRRPGLHRVSTARTSSLHSGGVARRKDLGSG
jgi:hypothetical protein